MSGLGATWRVRRIRGLLVPGFTKRFDLVADMGVTYFLGVPIGRFDVRRWPDGGVVLAYRRWPVVDVLDLLPERDGPVPAAGFVRLGARRVRFCRFSLER